MSDLDRDSRESIKNHERKEGDMMYLRIAAYCLEANRPLPDTLRNFMAKALRDIAAGADPKQALLLLKKPGRKKQYDYYEVALDVYALTQRGMSKTKAFQAVAEKYGLSDDHVRKEIYEPFDDVFELIETQETLDARMI